MKKAVSVLLAALLCVSFTVQTFAGSSSPEVITFGGGGAENSDTKDKNKPYLALGQDLSQDQLAKMTGVSRQTINAIEKGDYNPTINLCISICRVLDKTLDELFWEETE